MDTKYFGLYNGTILFYTTGGTFASDAWIASGGKNFGDVLGRKFLAITGDDGKEYNLNRDNISPITHEQLEEMLPKAHPALQLIVELDKLECKDPHCYAKWVEAKSFNHIPSLMENYPIEEIKEYYLKNYFK